MLTWPPERIVYLTRPHILCLANNPTAVQTATQTCAARTKTSCHPTTLTTLASLSPDQSFDSDVRRKDPVRERQSTLRAYTVGLQQPSRCARATAAAVSDGYAVVKVILNDMLAR